jgi:hypothetical protein
MIIFHRLRFKSPPTWRASSLYFNPPVAGWPRYTFRHWVPFSSPPATRRGTIAPVALKLQDFYQRNGTPNGCFIGGIYITRKSHINYFKNVSDEASLNNAGNEDQLAINSVLITPVFHSDLCQLQETWVTRYFCSLLEILSALRGKFRFS